MRVAIIAPWGSKTVCGIRTYTEYLIDGFRDLGESIDIDVTRLSRVHDIDARYLEWLAARATRNDPDVVLIEHEGARYGFEEVALYDALAGECERIITTIHSAQQLRDRQKDVILGKSDKAIVHNEHELRALHPYAKDVPVVVPHGCVIRDPPPKASACATLDIDPLPDFVALTFGMAGPWKQLEDVIETVHLTSGVTHVHVGEFKTSMPHGGYAAQVKRLAEYNIPTRHQWTGYVDDENLEAVFGAADVAIYANSWASESGSMAEMLGAGVPVLARDVPPYNDGRPVRLFDSTAELEAGVRDLRDNPEQRVQLGKSAQEWAQTRTWAHAADVHRDLFQYVLGEQDWETNYRTARRIERVKFLHTLWDADGDVEEAFGGEGYSDSAQIGRMIPRYTVTRLGSPPVLDVGCRAGDLAVYAAAQTDDSIGDWHGVDILADYVEQARSTELYESVEVAPAESLPWDGGTFGTAVIQEVLEHVPDQPRVLSELYRVLEPGGRLVVTMPNSTEVEGPIEHIGARSPVELQEMAEAAGFETIECLGMFGANNWQNLKSNTVGAFGKPGEEPEEDEDDGEN